MERIEVPELQPGESTMLEFTLEMPHDPVTLHVELESPVDRKTENDRANCYFGAPAPRELSCRAVLLPAGRGREAPNSPGKTPRSTIECWSTATMSSSPSYRVVASVMSMSTTIRR